MYLVREYDIKEKGKCEEDDTLLNEIYLGNRRVEKFANFIQTDSYIYYLSSDEPKILVRTNNATPSEFFIIGFNPYERDNPDPTAHSKVVVNTSTAKISMYGKLHHETPIIEASFDHCTATWDVRCNVTRHNEPSNLKDALKRYRERDKIGADNLEKTLQVSKEIFEKIRIESQKRKNKSPNA
ncbi:MAG: hypothetical protein IKO78_01840 [Bacilli bacterium]|nr:hypothetical protein [Bacilli bacterium]